jgi:uncharacterized membrane protein
MAERVSNIEGVPDQIWTFRGYGLSPAEFNTAMVHFYRAEVTRCNTWRKRLDATTNWAVLTSGAALSFVFSDPSHSHLMIPLNTLLVILFLVLETRRYRYYELWNYRVRLMETDFFAAMLAPPWQPSETWSSSLVESLRHPEFPITFLEAFGRRFRRNYQFIFVILALSWLSKVLIHPTFANTWQDMLLNATIGPIPGPVVLLIGILLNIALFAIGWLTKGLRELKGVIFSDSNGPIELIQAANEALSEDSTSRESDQS